MKHLFLILFFIFTGIVVFAHPWEPDYNLIIETNVSTEDLELIESLFETHNVKVFAILVQSGSDAENSNVSKIQAFLDRTHHQGVLCAIQGVAEGRNALDSVMAIVNLYFDDEITYLALSGSDLFAQFTELKKKDLKTVCVRHEKGQVLIEDLQYVRNNNLLFIEVAENKTLIEQLDIDLDHHEDADCQVFKVFPADTSLFFKEIGLRREDVISKYGHEEWAAVVLTSEMHRHVGVYSILGAKMGIRALEYFGAGADEMQLLSFAGQKPPISCLNDGLQVSTGATLGHGLIQISNDSIIAPEVMFSYLGRQIKIKLKDEYRKKVYQEVRQYRLVYGLENDMYWELVRNFALKCWFDWDRNEIFEIKMVKM